MIRSTKLGVKFVILVVVILSVTLAISTLWFHGQQQRLLREQLLERSQILGHFASLVSTEAILSYDFVALEGYVRDASQRPDIVFSAVLDGAGKPLTNFIDHTKPEIHRLSAGGEFDSIPDLLQVAQNSPDIIIQSFLITERDNILGSVVIGISLTRLKNDLLSHMLTQLMIYCAIILFLSTAIYLVFRYNVLFPVRELISASRRVAEGRYDKPVRVFSHDELGKLSEAFNQMMHDVRNDQELLNYQANFDSLTGLPNRMQAMERLSSEISRSKRSRRNFAVIFIDLNNFKYVNDTMGHKAGDQLLISMSERFKSALRDSDILARLGGDEFLVILPTADRPTEVREVAMRLIDSLVDPIQIEKRDVFLRCSMGITIYPVDGDNAEELMANADNAMYQAKLSNTEDISFFAPEMNRAIKERMELEHDLHLALENDEFKLYYQPIIDCKTLRPIATEVLLRWHHPDKGVIHPNTFIPIAESTGRIILIGQWVLKTALRSVRHLLEQGLEPGYVSANVSRVQLTKDFESTVQQVLDDSNLPPSRLRLEVTESALMEHYGELPEMLRRLDSIGVKLVLDDFGTGFSSLNYLKHFPFYTLKIDKSFIDSVPDNEADTSLVRGIIAMSRSLGLQVVAEGIEHQHQQSFLNSAGVDGMQGYYFARPMPLTDYESYLQQFVLDPGANKTAEDKRVS